MAMRPMLAVDGRASVCTQSIFFKWRKRTRAGAENANRRVPKKKQCNAPEGCFKFKTVNAFRTTEWNSSSERLCRHCFNGKKPRKWGYHNCFECGEQKHNKEFRNVVGKLTSTKNRNQLRCDACVNKHKRREEAQEEQRMTEMTIQQPIRNDNGTNHENSEERFFMNQFTALEAWLSKYHGTYPKRYASNEEEAHLAKFMNNIRQAKQTNVLSPQRTRC